MEKKYNSKPWNFYLILFFIVIAIGCIYVIYINTQNSDMWCKINKPMMNLSAWDEKVAYCYNEGWEKYCQISYPEYCPNNNYTDYDRCLKNCDVYGTKDCPCIKGE